MVVTAQFSILHRMAESIGLTVRINPCSPSGSDAGFDFHLLAPFCKHYPFGSTHALYVALTLVLTFILALLSSRSDLCNESQKKISL
jgi:hypothetical protein